MRRPGCQPGQTKKGPSVSPRFYRAKTALTFIFWSRVLVFNPDCSRIHNPPASTSKGWHNRWVPAHLAQTIVLSASLIHTRAQWLVGRINVGMDTEHMVQSTRMGPSPAENRVGP